MGEGSAPFGETAAKAQARSTEPAEEDRRSWEKVLNVKAQQAEPCNPYALFSAAVDEDLQEVALARLDGAVVVPLSHMTLPVLQNATPSEQH